MPVRKYNTAVETWIRELESSIIAGAKWSQYQVRKRQMSAVQLVRVMVLGWLRQPSASLNELAASAAEQGCQISAQGLHARMNYRAVGLLTGVLREVLQQRLPVEPLESERLKQFSQIYITDSTLLKVSDCLRSEFAGMGQTAQIKLQVRLEYLSGQIDTLQVQAGRQPDQSCDLPAQHLQAGSLQLFDLGYFKQERLQAIAQRHAFFVTRYQSQTALYGLDTETRLALATCLRQHTSDTFEWEGLLGLEVKLPVRLVAKRRSVAQAQQRRRKVKRKAKSNHQTCSSQLLALQDWEILVTNLPAEHWSLSDIFALYALRWHIELVFRAWKSQLKLAQLGNWRPERLFCQLYAHLIACVLAHAWTAAWRYRHSAEYSFPKCLYLLQAWLPALLKQLALPHPNFLALSCSLDNAFLRFARKEKRRKVPSSFAAFFP
jgi:hypothetical protein